jgi:hypothetical protein
MNNPVALSCGVSGQAGAYLADFCLKMYTTFGGSLAIQIEHIFIIWKDYALRVE